MKFMLNTFFRSCKKSAYKLILSNTNFMCLFVCMFFHLNDIEFFLLVTCIREKFLKDDKFSAVLIHLCAFISFTIISFEASQSSALSRNFKYICSVSHF